MAHEQLALPCLYLLSDYPSPDTGSAGQYDASLRVYFPDVLAEIHPDSVKVLNKIEVVYESLRELPISIRTFRRYPLSDAGSLYEEVSVQVKSGATEPGVFYGTSAPVWGTAAYATLRIFNAELHFAVTQGKGFGVGLSVTANLTPFRLLRMVYHFGVEEATWRGSGVTLP